METKQAKAFGGVPALIMLSMLLLSLAGNVGDSHPHSGGNIEF